MKKFEFVIGIDAIEVEGDATEVEVSDDAAAIEEWYTGIVEKLTSEAQPVTVIDGEGRQIMARITGARLESMKKSFTF